MLGFVSRFQQDDWGTIQMANLCQEAEQCNIPGGLVGLTGEGVQKCSACISNLNSIDYSAEQPYLVSNDCLPQRLTMIGLSVG